MVFLRLVVLASIFSWPGRSTRHPALWFDRAAMQQPKGVKMAEDVRAEIVASVLEVVVHEGDQIGEGDTLVLLESMKMEIPVLAEVAGTVSKVSVSVGDVIQAGDLIAVIS
jgi:acetyl-CoA carboxylase biotin carboxyl carrier protein